MHKVLIANRGEIAVRITRACADAELDSVAVYSDQDHGAAHVLMAGSAYALEGSSPSATYLNADKIIEIAKRSGADAVHPGYGFLSENADFAAAVLAAGLVWIGPPPSVIRDLGDKTISRLIALAAGVPVIPGTAEPVTGSDDVIAFAKEHGMPLLIKATFGGGGRGIKVVRHQDDIVEALSVAVREATAAFSRGECFVESYIENARHVEVQVLADSHGNVLIAGTRDCSLQRRNQKLVEESPAPLLTAEQREVLSYSAEMIFRSVGYQGAGTVEFLLSQDGRLYFLEVNTRLQVEHPVTEETSGIDLVLEQFRIANGHAIKHSAGFMERGHSIEFRINAEDPARGFLPSPGTVTHVRFPSGPGVRVDTALADNSLAIPQEFDSLVAKIIVTGEDRAHAIRRARRALAETEIDGIATTLPFHRAVLEEGAFSDSENFRIHTNWVETEWKNDLVPQSDFSDALESPTRRTIPVEIDGKRVVLGIPENLLAGIYSGPDSSNIGFRAIAQHELPGDNVDLVVAEIAGTIISVPVSPGDQLNAGDTIATIEAMKMESKVVAQRACTIEEVLVAPGSSVTRGTVIVRLSAV